MLARKIFSNTAWQVLGKAVTAILGIISIKFATNYLSRPLYGEYTTIYDYTALFAIAADFGLFTIAVREMAHGNSKQASEKIVGNILSLRIVFALFSLGAGALIAALIPAYKESYIPIGVIVVAAATLLTLIAGTMSSVLQYNLKMHWAAIGLMIGKIITVGYILLSILVLFPKNPAQGFFHLQFAWIIGSLFALFFTYSAAAKLIKIRLRFDFLFWKDVLARALPYGLALVLGTIYFRMGTLMLSLFNLKEQVGYYGVPLRFLEILQIIPHYFMGSVLPVLTLSLKTSGQRAAKITRYALNALAAAGMPVLAGGVLLAWPITAAVSSPDFLSRRTGDSLIFGSDLALKILLAGMIFTYLHVGLSYAFVAMGRQMEILKVNFAAAALNVFLNYLLAPRYGFIGAAATAAITEACVFAVLAARMRKYLRGIWDVSFLSKTVFSALAMAAAIYAAQDFFNKTLYSFSLFVLIPLGAIVFFACMYASKAVTKEMLAALRRKEPSGGAADELSGAVF